MLKTTSTEERASAGQSDGLSWSHVYNGALCKRGTMVEAGYRALFGGYGHFAWNGRVYGVVGTEDDPNGVEFPDTGLTVNDLAQT